MNDLGGRPLRTLVLRRLMPAALAGGVAVWAASAYLAHADQMDRLRETLRQRLELRAAVSAEQIEAVSEAVAAAARNSITISAMAEQNVQRVVRPYLKSISFANATTERVALVDYRARLIVADRESEWVEPAGWIEAFDRVTEGSLQSLLDENRLILAAPVVLGSYVEGALVADISLASLFTELEDDFRSEIVLWDVTEPQYDIWRDGSIWWGEVVWPVGENVGIAIKLTKSISGAGFWDNPVQKSLVSIFALLLALTAGAIVMAAASVAAPVRKLVDDLEERGLEIDAPGLDAPAEISTLTRRFIGAAADVELALLRERELTAQQSQFVSMVSHEFRTPLAIIEGAAGALQRRHRRMDDGAVAEKLQVIKGAVTRLLRLMESTLSAAMLQSENFKLEVGEVNFPSLTNRLIDERRSLSEDVQIDADIENLPDTINADERLLTSVIDNLLSNAVKYGGKPAQITIRGWIEAEQALLSVTDNGIGIPADQISRIGERFFRASTSSGIVGTGVGLNMVKAVLYQHGGSLDVVSVVGEGSTFTIRLPVKSRAFDTLPEHGDAQNSKEHEPAARVCRLIYTSEASTNFDERSLATLRSQASKKNGKISVTGALAYLDGHFAQVLEGPKQAIDHLVEEIQEDPRHRNFTVVSCEMTTRRAYQEWRMNQITASQGISALAALETDVQKRLPV